MTGDDRWIPGRYPGRPGCVVASRDHRGGVHRLPREKDYDGRGVLPFRHGQSAADQRLLAGALPAPAGRQDPGGGQHHRGMRALPADGLRNERGDSGQALLLQPAGLLHRAVCPGLHRPVDRLDRGVDAGRDGRDRVRLPAGLLRLAPAAGECTVREGMDCAGYPDGGVHGPFRTGPE